MTCNSDKAHFNQIIKSESTQEPDEPKIIIYGTNT